MPLRSQPGGVLRRRLPVLRAGATVLVEVLEQQPVGRGGVLRHGPAGEPAPASRPGRVRRRTRRGRSRASRGPRRPRRRGCGGATAARARGSRSRRRRARSRARRARPVTAAALVRRQWDAAAAPCGGGAVLRDAKNWSTAASAAAATTLRMQDLERCAGRSRRRSPRRAAASGSRRGHITIDGPAAIDTTIASTAP